MKIAVYGAGAVGAYFGGRLAQAGLDVSFVARGEHLQAMLSRGLKVDSIQGDFVIHPLQASANAEDVGVSDLVLVCVKGWQVEEVAITMHPLVGEHTLILPLLNGVDAVDILSRHWGANKVLNGLCGIFAKVVDAGHIEHIGSEPWLQFGEQDNQITVRAQHVLEQLQRSDGFKVKLVANIRSAVWRKFIFIASTSGVGSVTRAKFGEVRANPNTRKLLQSVIDEVIAVAVAHKVSLPSNIKELVWQQICKSADNSDTSMQRDVLAGKPSELDSQTGAVIRLAKQLAVATPYNEMIYASLLPQERRARSKSSQL
jgi:2-dehydropantoate 2-reductase